MSCTQRFQSLTPLCLFHPASVWSGQFNQRAPKPPCPSEAKVCCHNSNSSSLRCAIKQHLWDGDSLFPSEENQFSNKWCQEGHNKLDVICKSSETTLNMAVKGWGSITVTRTFERVLNPLSKKSSSHGEKEHIQTDSWLPFLICVSPAPLH